MFLFNYHFYLQGKNTVYITAFLHLVLVCFGIWSLVEEMVFSQEPVSNYEIIYIGIHYAVHFILILCLIIGTYIEMPFFLLPWLGAAFLAFLVVTVFTLAALKDIQLHNILICLLNFVCIGAYWFSWYTVFVYFKNAYKKNTKIYEKCFL
ncbi:hypothetical protein NQ314_020377 [Rhamnusium bicolor]|uniref:Uncharacterized protein n=1 Tax=Rhamnusium bicolor TaxID=1586634 RepID=A0AAV8WKH3_9CUCU|nr:hypothetical protein NQ314_020377 [Rhamnusium bicolor]